MFYLQKLINEMILETKHFLIIENLQCVYHLTEIGKFCFDKIPKTVLNTFPLQQISAAVDSLVKYSTVNDIKLLSLEDIEQNLLELQMQQQSIVEEEQLKPKVKLIKPIEIAHPEPPENYCALPILPESQEINRHAKKPYLRPNIVKGEYQSWQHYLDVQFRLLREDFVGPLREGIYEHLHNPMLRGGDILVYQNVTIKQPVCLATGIGFDISSSMKLFSKVNWDYTKRLINGSLLCLSTDNFETIMFATVAQRETKQLEKGIVTIKFESSTDGFQLHSNAEYTMVESVAYLESYRHVLKKFQAICEEHEVNRMPFEKYIVKCTFDNIPPPRYLKCFEHTAFNLKGIIEIKNELARSKVNLTQTSTWPDADLTNLDPSQMKALQTALTHEISVIQGPPGTGKTYVGLTIVKAFLAHKKVWDPMKTNPILVVCYTNHVLDQFLEGIHNDMIQGKHPSVTRIGGRCTSTTLQNFILREKVSKAKKDKIVPGREYRNFRDAKSKTIIHKELMIETLKKPSVSACLNYQILRIQDLADIIIPFHCEQLLEKAFTDHPIELWLGLLHKEPENQKMETHDIQHAEQVVKLPQPKMLEDENNDTEVQMIQDDRQVEGTQIVYRPEEVKDIEFENVPISKADGMWEVIKISQRKNKHMIKTQFNRNLQPMTTDEVSNYPDLWSMDETQRWRLYLYWRDRYISRHRQQLEHQSNSYKDACQELEKSNQDVNLTIVLGSDVVGMTTTGAAKHNYIIKAIRPKIVIVEEAAEIFEPHILTSLSPSVEQLVLIGDHQQLRPKPTYFELEKKYDFNISLFERLAINGCPVQTLNIQHRMRPEIASLITPAIYKELHNHESVFSYEHVQGVGKNVFFVTHTEPELAGGDDRQSHSNPHEAKYLGALCDYLLKQGYKPEDITILTLYRGQLFEIKNILRVRKIKGVRTAVVDDFQGEENRIILLSLVRSNNKQKIGFVGIENPVCVALSRAKMSLFIIGNVEMLRDKVQTVWPKMIKRLTEMGSIGNALPLHCHIHQDQKIDARVPQDFLKCPEGGCQKKCEARLPCGHVCPRMCHPYDIEHLEYKCLKDCKKQLSCGHICKSKCIQCFDGCSPCKEKAIKVLPNCGHSEHCLCSDNPQKLNCLKLCDKTLKCGHFCQEKCSQPCTTQCKVKVDKKPPCGHTVEDFCYLKEDEVKCSHPCGALLDCEHQCTGTCFTCNEGRLHKGCTLKCYHTLICGHACEYPCTPSCPPCYKVCTNFCKHRRCRKNCYEVCSPCTEFCGWSCPHYKCTMPCEMPCNRPPCNEPCKKRLKKCGHLCISLCGEVCPNLCRICDKEVVTEIFFGTEDAENARFILLSDCNHIFEVGMLDQWMSMKNSDSAVNKINTTVENTKPIQDAEVLPDVSANIQRESQAITLKVCPKCKTPIRYCYRYGNDIKRKLKDFKAVKKSQMDIIDSIKLRQDFAKMKKKFKRVETYGYTLFNDSEFTILYTDKKPKSIAMMLTDYSFVREKVLSVHFPYIVKTKISFILRIISMYTTLKKLIGYQISHEIHKIITDLNKLNEFILQDFLSQQQLSDAESEMRRLTLLAKATELQIRSSFQRIDFNEKDNEELLQIITNIEKCDWKEQKVTEEKEVAILKKLNFLEVKYQVYGMSETKQLEIFKAIGIIDGQWYKCPNDHYYTLEINIFGRGMLQYECPECTAEIEETSPTAGDLQGMKMDNSKCTSSSEIDC